MDTLINDISLNDENELATLLVLAECGNAKAQYRLAVRYKNGHGIIRDYAKALQWFHASASNGYACAQYMLGEFYRWGQLVKLNYLTAAWLVRKSSSTKPCRSAI